MAQSIVDHVQKTDELAKAFRDKWLPVLGKQIARFRTNVNDLVLEPLAEEEQEGAATAELSVHAQYLLEEDLKKFRDVMAEMLQDHRQIHPPISKCGKDLDRFFQANLGELMRNEKDLTSDNQFRPLVNQLIFEHFLSLGRVDVAETFVKECADAPSFALPSDANLQLMRTIMEPFRQRQFQPAIQWVTENAPHEHDLLFRLHSEHILQLLETGNKKDAILYCRALQPFADKYKTIISHLMFMAVSWPNVIKNRYEYMFCEGRWLQLEKELANCFSECKNSPLSSLINVGAKAVPTILKMRALIRRNPPVANFTPLPSSVPAGGSGSGGGDGGFLTDELLCEVPIEGRYHSSFCCPILRTQGTESNPPMRLNCGHVISQDALTKLAAQSRSQRLKCPYCPEESNQADAVRVYF